MYYIYDNHIRDDEGRAIPCDERNSDFRRYLKWCAEGNTPVDKRLEVSIDLKIAQIKQDAQSDILNEAALFKQMNLLTKTMVELLDVVKTIAPNYDVGLDLRALKTRIDAIRKRSDDRELKVRGAATKEEVNNA